MFYLPNKFSHMACFGTTGTGKSAVGEIVCETEYINNGKKIVDLTNNRFIEGISWCNGTRIPKFKKNLEKAQRKYGDIFKPRGFPTKIYHPIVSTLPNKLPPNFELFTLPIDFFAYEEVLRVLTNDNISDSAIIALTQHVEKLKDSDSFSVIPGKIMEAVDQKVLKTKGFNDVPVYFFFDSSNSASSANRPLMKVKNLGIFGSKSFPHVLDDEKIKLMLSNNKEVSVFSTRFIDQRHNKIKLAINMYLLMKIRELSKDTNETIVYIREARELFPNLRSSDKSLKVLGEQAESMAKDCRKAGIQLLLDTQTPWDLPDAVLDQIDTKFIFRHDRRISEIIDMYRGTRPLDDERVKNIKGLRNHKFYIAGSHVDISANPFNGATLEYKITDHLEKNEDELELLRKKYPKSEWYATKSFVQQLADEWRGSTDKIGTKYEQFFKEQNEKASARQIGVTYSELRVFKYFARYPDKEWNTFTEIQRACGMAPATANNSLARMHDRGFIKKDADTNKLYGLTETGFNFIKTHSSIIKDK